MALTEEQRERIRINRERALEVKKRKAEERAKALSVGGGGAIDDGGGVSPVGDHLKHGNGVASSAGVAKALSRPAETREKCNGIGGGVGGTLDDLEDWEVGASAHVTKEEAMRKYCLPQGTLAVCSYVEKPNPRNKGWTPMRLYERADIRRRARERFGGLEGLVEERRKRDRKRFANDMKETKDVFKRRKS
mmetsp:Transcript_17357/g.34808  ORF Transcript_17357/g.34808 Transcript_17357/m.34808 type:complete len:191 (-) Transcript_17357:1109-1681(-)